jgi:hypothetical protein
VCVCRRLLLAWLSSVLSPTQDQHQLLGTEGSPQSAKGSDSFKNASGNGYFRPQGLGVPPRRASNTDENPWGGREKEKIPLTSKGSGFPLLSIRISLPTSVDTYSAVFGSVLP